MYGRLVVWIVDLVESWNQWLQSAQRWTELWQLNRLFPLHRHRLWPLKSLCKLRCRHRHVLASVFPKWLIRHQNPTLWCAYRRFQDPWSCRRSWPCLPHWPFDLVRHWRLVLRCSLSRWLWLHPLVRLRYVSRVPAVRRFQYSHRTMCDWHRDWKTMRYPRDRRYRSPSGTAAYHHRGRWSQSRRRWLPSLRHPCRDHQHLPLVGCCRGRARTHKHSRCTSLPSPLPSSNECHSSLPGNTLDYLACRRQVLSLLSRQS